MSHPFGDLLSQHLHRRHGLSQSKLAAGILQAPTIITAMCKGRRLTGPQARERVIAIIRWLHEQGALDSIGDANALLKAAGMSGLTCEHSIEAQVISELGDTLSLTNDSGQKIEPLRRNNLPTQSTHLFGRQQQILDIHQLLFTPDSKNRIVTLTGPGGVGKTCLALQVAAKMSDAVFVPLASTHDGNLIADAVLLALGVASSSDDPFKQLAYALRHRASLIVLDNFEQLLVDEEAQRAIHFVTALAEAAPNVQFLVTSRTPLRLSGECIYDVQVLKLEAACDLFVARANAAGVRLDEPYSGIVRDICERLDCLPLAIELAAARVRIFGPQILLQRLSTPLQVLTHGARDFPQRHRTLRAAIDWSYGLLSEPERRLFRRLGVFPDGATLSMIEAISSEESLSDIADLIQKLVEHSLITVNADQQAPRFQMLETLRDYAASALAESGEMQIIERLAGEWYATYCEIAYVDDKKYNNGDWFLWFEREWQSMRTLMLSLLECDEPAIPIRIVGCIGETIRLIGPKREGWELISRILAHPRAKDDTQMYARLLYAASHVVQNTGDIKRAEAYVLEALPLARVHGSDWLYCRLFSLQANYVSARSEIGLARTLYHQSIALARTCGDRRYLALNLIYLGGLETWNKQFELAFECLHEGASIGRKIGFAIAIFLSEFFLGGVYETMGDLPNTAAYTHAALATVRQYGLTFALLLCHMALGDVALESNDVASALEQYAAAAAGWEAHGNFATLSENAFKFGYTLHLAGRSDEGVLMLRDAIRGLCEVQNTIAVDFAVSRLAWVASDCDQHEAAICLMAAASVLMTKWATPRGGFETMWQKPRLMKSWAALGEHRATLLWNHVQGMTPEACVALALLPFEIINVNVRITNIDQPNTGGFVGEGIYF